MERVRDFTYEIPKVKEQNNKKRKVIVNEKTKTLNLIRNLTLKRRMVLINFIVTLILIISIVVSYTEMVKISSNIKVIEIDNESLSMEIDSLKNTLNPLISKNKIEKIATTKLNMIYPQYDNIVKTNSDSGLKIGQIHE